MEKKLDSDEVNTLIEILDCFMRNQEVVINLWEFSNYERNLRNKLMDIYNQMTKEEEEMKTLQKRGVKMNVGWKFNRT